MLAGRFLPRSPSTPLRPKPPQNSSLLLQGLATSASLARPVHWRSSQGTQIKQNKVILLGWPKENKSCSSLAHGRTQ